MTASAPALPTMRERFADTVTTLLDTNRRIVVVITIVSTLLLIIERYNTITTGVEVVDRVIIYLFVPLLIILFVFRDSPKEYGFRIGDWKAGLAMTGLTL